VARRPLEKEGLYLDGGRRTTQLMRDSLGTPAMHDSDSDRAEFDKECQRVGVTWNSFLEWERLNAGGGSPSPDGTIIIEGGLPALTAMLRPLPSGIGEAGFLEAMRKEGEVWRARAEEATRRSEARRRRRDSKGDRPGA
jgi:hypothetical protein